MKKLNKGINVTLTERDIKRIYFIVPNQENYIINDGTNLRQIDVLGASFLSREFDAEIVEIMAEEVKNIPWQKSTVFATYSAGVLLNWRFFLYFYKIIRLGFNLKRKKIPLIFIVGDSFYPDTAAIGTVLTGLTGGCVFAGPNPPSEMKTYGYLNIVWPVIFIEIVYEIRKAAHFHSSFSTRQNACFVAAGQSATAIRIKKMNELKLTLATLGIQVIESDGLLPKEEYIQELGKYKFYATTNYTQEIYLFGPKVYQRKISQTTLTGRTYNALAAGMVLITNECESMKQMGFYKNTHYLDLEEFINNRSYMLPSQNILEEIAFNGRIKLNSILERQVIFSVNY